jgi:hypothetical protein
MAASGDVREDDVFDAVAAVVTFSSHSSFRMLSTLGACEGSLKPNGAHCPQYSAKRSLTGAPGGARNGKVPGALAPNLLLTVPMMRRCRGALTVKGVIRAWLSYAMAMTHYRRMVDARGSK